MAKSKFRQTTLTTEQILRTYPHSVLFPLNPGIEAMPSVAMLLDFLHDNDMAHIKVSYCVLNDGRNAVVLMLRSPAERRWVQENVVPNPDRNASTPEIL